MSETSQPVSTGKRGGLIGGATAVNDRRCPTAVIIGGNHCQGAPRYRARSPVHRGIIYPSGLLPTS
jgi:hypothetical protein